MGRQVAEEREEGGGFIFWGRDKSLSLLQGMAWFGWMGAPNIQEAKKQLLDTNKKRNIPIYCIKTI